MDRPFRLAYLVSHPIQYQAPFLRRIAAHPKIDLTVFFMSDMSVRGYHDPGFGIQVKWDVPLTEGYRHQFLPAVGGNDRISFWRPFVYGLRRHLADGEFDCLLLCGYAHQANLRAIKAARKLGIKVMMFGESHLKSHRRSKVKLWLKGLFLRRLFRWVDAFLAIGTLNREYYLHYGVPEHRIFWMPYSVDNEFFRSRAVEASQTREKLRQELGLEPDRPVILFASKFQARKRAGDLLEAYIRLSPDGFQEPHPYLLFIGDGEERASLEHRVRQRKWSSTRFLGFRNQTEMPRYYDLCDVFVLPSEYEPWGLVVNEVMNAGKAVIVTDHVGCGPDLVRDGENGYVIPVGDVDALADRLRRLMVNLGLVHRMGEESLHRISTWTYDTGVHALLQAMERCAS